MKLVQLIDYLEQGGKITNNGLVPGRYLYIDKNSNRFKVASDDEQQRVYVLSPIDFQLTTWEKFYRKKGKFRYLYESPHPNGKQLMLLVSRDGEKSKLGYFAVKTVHVTNFGIDNIEIFDIKVGGKIWRIQHNQLEDWMWIQVEELSQKAFYQE